MIPEKLQNRLFSYKTGRFDLIWKEKIFLKKLKKTKKREEVW